MNTKVKVMENVGMTLGTPKNNKFNKKWWFKKNLLPINLGNTYQSYYLA
jgi:hypothetical protein